MISSNKAGSNLFGFSATESVYAMPFVDEAYRKANSQFANLPADGDFRTTSVYYDPNRPTIGGTNQPYENPSTSGTQEEQAKQGDTDSWWNRWNPFRWAPYSNDGAEADEQPIDSNNVTANENFAIGAIVVIFAGTLIWRKL